MISVRRAHERGYAEHGWLKSYHSFSFADYYDPQHMGFGPLRVINDDWIAPGMGFGTHPHQNMEIITYVLEGAIAHQDSMGNGSTIRPGNVQYMSAGTGVRHSEFNPSPSEHTRLLQIWIEPDVLGKAPRYNEKTFSAAEKNGQLRLVASPDGEQDSVAIRQNARLYIGLFDGDQQADIRLSPQRLTYVHLARGALSVNGVPLQEGDAVKLQDESSLHLSAGKQAEVLVFDLPY
ncbi:pirin family protein [Undibacterium oligocarboniphilum]|uniref:Pirin family protein n=1 Tax=Undibacterium oligocarboniphilum TaxID=666702 RepID=A0A850QIQ9_9BURK|nr:pirin family protein [Undibacterium oligocarboniphilum]MBC3869680.1 pirin family protein [Undibacterium oligocarboniphilum]NVO77283.1 pirin family protein [Undibacterium oligocarboniphilum]